MSLTVRDLHVLRFMGAIASMIIFYMYGGWLLGSKPIETISSYDLENVPPPPYAKSFAINHGEAIYYRDGVASEHPYKQTLIYISLSVPVLVAGWAHIELDLRRRRRRRHAAQHV